jgi:hypothetical protein
MIADFEVSRRLLQLKGNHAVRFLIRFEVHTFYLFLFVYCKLSFSDVTHPKVQGSPFRPYRERFGPAP